MREYLVSQNVTIVNYHPLKWVASCEFYSTHIHPPVKTGGFLARFYKSCRLFNIVVQAVMKAKKHFDLAFDNIVNYFPLSQGVSNIFWTGVIKPLSPTLATLRKGTSRDNILKV
ncbi:MAG: hypothetical protein ACXAEU_03295 [Candidatus Hodarchaeales archaeon]|jgi:hypothetical protein